MKKTLTIILAIMLGILLIVFLYLKLSSYGLLSKWETKSTSILTVKYPSDYTASPCSDYPTLVESDDNFVSDSFKTADLSSVSFEKDGIKILISAYKDSPTLENGMCTSFLDSGRWISKNGEKQKEYTTNILEQKKTVFDFEDDSTIYGMIDKEQEDTFSPNDGISVCSETNKCVYIRYIVDSETLYNQEFNKIQGIINSLEVDFTNL